MENELGPQNARGEGFQELGVTQKSNPTKGFSSRAHRRLQGVIDREQLRRSVKSPQRLQQLAANESGRTGYDDADRRQPGRSCGHRGLLSFRHNSESNDAVQNLRWVNCNLSALGTTNQIRKILGLRTLYSPPDGRSH